MPDVPITVNPPHFARPRAARIVAIRYCVMFDDEPYRAVWYDEHDLPDVTIDIRQEAP